MKFKFKIEYINISLFVVLLMILINGRSLLGVYLFGFRIGELITGFSFLSIVLILLKYNYFKKVINPKSIISYLMLSSYFFIINYINEENYFNLTLYKNSAFIWYISFFFFGIFVFSNTNITKYYLIFGYLGLFLQYIFNVIYYPKFLSEFFDLYSDKTQFLKGSEIAIFFIVVTFFTNRIYEKRTFLDVFVIFSSFYLPLMFFKSRAGGLAVFIYFIFEIYKYRSHFKKNKKRTLAVAIISIISFTLSSFYIVDFSVELKKAPLAVEQVVKHKYVISNTYDDEKRIIFYRDNRFYSADGNFNWRLQLWQDVFSYINEENKIFTGIGFSQKLPMFDTPWYAGEDGLNENTHNYFINVYSKVGIVGFTFLISFFYFLFIQEKIFFSKKDFLTFLFPLFFISMFDGSMENPYFGIVFYFFLSSFYTGIKFRKEY